MKRAKIMKLSPNKKIVGFKKLNHGKVKLKLECGHILTKDADTFTGLKKNPVGNVTSCESCPQMQID